MANAFRSILGGSSQSGLLFTVTCDSQFAGMTIVMTDGTTTLTNNCPSLSPYVVKFMIPNGGTWTISAQGTAVSQIVVIPSNAVLYYSIPDGKTVTPTDSIQTWLACAQLSTSYTTLEQVLADSTTLEALIASDNAVDYMVRSTTWASGVCADESAMTLIGADDYCARVLLSDSIWLNEICDSTYFENVLNVKVPIMTSDTTPSGVASASSSTPPYEPYRAFDGDDSTAVSPATVVSVGWVQYQFVNPVCINKVAIMAGTGARVRQFDILMSNDGSTWENLLSDTNPNDEIWHYYKAINNKYYLYFRLNIKNGHNNQWWQVRGLQFYGRVSST